MIMYLIITFFYKVIIITKTNYIVKTESFTVGVGTWRLGEDIKIDLSRNYLILFSMTPTYPFFI